MKDLQARYRTNTADFFVIFYVGRIGAVRVRLVMARWGSRRFPTPSKYEHASGVRGCL